MGAKFVHIFLNVFFLISVRPDKKKNKNGQAKISPIKQGLTDQEVYSWLRENCTQGDPQDKYAMLHKTGPGSNGTPAPHILGQGVSGTVILASDIITDVKVAIKVIHMPSQQKKELVLKELQVLGMMPQLLCYFEGKITVQ